MRAPCSPPFSQDRPGPVFCRSQLSSLSLLLGGLFRRRSRGHDDSGDCFGGARSCSLLEMGCGDSLDAHLCGLPLLLELLQLLRGEETHRLVASNELRARRHGGEDDVAAQPAKAFIGWLITDSGTVIRVGSFPA